MPGNLNMDADTILLIARGGATAVGVFCLVMGYKLYVKVIDMPAPQTDMEVLSYDNKYKAIKHFLGIALIFTAVSAGLEIFNRMVGSNANVKFEVQGMDVISSVDIVPEILHNNIPVTLQNGFSPIHVLENDLIALKLNGILKKYNDEREARLLNLKLLSQEQKGDIGYDN